MKEFRNEMFHYHLNANDILHGEFKEWDRFGNLRIHSNYKDGVLYGEYKRWDSSGNLVAHFLFLDSGKRVDADPADLPSNSEELLLFRIKYGNLPLLNESF